MNWDVIESNWKQFTDHVKEQWDRLGDDDMRMIAGRRDRLAEQIVATYGISNDEAERQIQSFEASNITFKGALKARTYARITSAEADYMIATAKCGSKSGAEKDLCLRDAKTDQTKTVDDAIANREAVESRSQKDPASHEALR
jgi:uncharacterized protein YjbJ (UPF0337 family)